MRRVAELCKQVTSGLLDLVYPPRCLVCETYDRPVLCEICAASFEDLPEPVCAVCGRPVNEESDRVCRLCERTHALTEDGWGFDAARAVSVYQGPLRHAVHLLKYRGAELLGEPLGAHLANRCVVDGLIPDVSTLQGVVFVPMHPSRERQRGFNQTALLAAPVADMLGVPLLARAVRRVRKTPPQVGLSPEARRRSLSDTGIFASDPALVAGKHLLLIDDVFTTGATVSACAASLKGAGAASVVVATLAAGG